MSQRILIVAVVAALMAGAAGAQMAGNGPGASPPVVAPDGTVLVVRPAGEPGTQSGAELVAVSAAGTVAWRVAVGGSVELAVLGNLVVVAEGPRTPGTPEGSPATTVSGLQLANGVAAWTLELDAHTFDIVAAGDRAYLSAVKPDQTQANAGPQFRQGGRGPRGPGAGSGGPGGTGAGNGQFSLVAISAAGDLLWTVPL